MTTEPMSSRMRVAYEIVDVAGRCDRAAVTRATEFCRVESGRWFFTGQGRSGLVARMAAMRWLHLGRDAHYVGEATAPAIGPGDHLVALSASGATPITLHLAELAVGFGADLLTLTGSQDNPLADLATVNLAVPVTDTVQFAGSLFEQSALIVLDSLVLDLTGAAGDTYQQMSTRHTNLQ